MTALHKNCFEAIPLHRISSDDEILMFLTQMTSPSSPLNLTETGYSSRPAGNHAIQAASLRSPLTVPSSRFEFPNARYSIPAILSFPHSFTHRGYGLPYHPPPQKERMFCSYYTNICSICQDEKTGTCGPAQPKVLKKASGNARCP